MINVRSDGAGVSRQQGVNLDAHLTRTGTGGVRVEYRVHNASATAIGVYNGVPPETGDALQHAYVDFADGELVLRAINLPEPGDGIRSAVHTAPYVTRVPAGGTFSDAFELPPPVVVNDPNRVARLSLAARGGPVAATAPREARAIRLIIGWFAVGPRTQLVSLEPYYPGFASARGDTGTQVLLEARASFAQPVRVLDLESGKPRG